MIKFTLRYLWRELEDGKWVTKRQIKEVCADVMDLEQEILLGVECIGHSTQPCLSITASIINFENPTIEVKI